MSLLSVGRQIGKRRVFVPLLLLVAVIVFLLAFASRESVAIATADVQQGPFSVSIKTSGEIRATNSTTLSVPRARYNQLQIVFLVPEGTTVQPGDIVVKFSTTDVDKTISDKDQELTLLESDAKKTKADQQSRMADLRDNLRNA